MTKNTVLSAGLALVEILKGTAAVMERITEVFPGYADEAVLPYISYRRKGLETTGVKTGVGARSAMIEVMCFAESYGEAVGLAEAVNAALDGYRGEAAGMQVRGISLENAVEEDAGDAKAQVLEYRVRI